jgi:hypothetical protein
MMLHFSRTTSLVLVLFCYSLRVNATPTRPYTSCLLRIQQTYNTTTNTHWFNHSIDSWPEAFKVYSDTSVPPNESPKDTSKYLSGTMFVLGDPALASTLLRWIQETVDVLGNERLSPTIGNTSKTEQFCEEYTVFDELKHHFAGSQNCTAFRGTFRQERTSSKFLECEQALKVPGGGGGGGGDSPRSFNKSELTSFLKCLAVEWLPRSNGCHRFLRRHTFFWVIVDYARSSSILAEFVPNFETIMTNILDIQDSMDKLERRTVWINEIAEQVKPLRPYTIQYCRFENGEINLFKADQTNASMLEFRAEYSNSIWKNSLRYSKAIEIVRGSGRMSTYLDKSSQIIAQNSQLGDNYFLVVRGSERSFLHSTGLLVHGCTHFEERNVPNFERVQSENGSACSRKGFERFLNENYVENKAISVAETLDILQSGCMKYEDYSTDLRNLIRQVSSIEKLDREFVDIEELRRPVRTFAEKFWSEMENLKKWTVAFVEEGSPTNIALILIGVIVLAALVLLFICSIEKLCCCPPKKIALENEIDIF